MREVATPCASDGERLRFTAEEMPEWLTTASAALAEKEAAEGAAAEAPGADLGAAWIRLEVVSRLEAQLTAARSDAAAADAECTQAREQLETLEKELELVMRRETAVSTKLLDHSEPLSAATATAPASSTEPEGGASAFPERDFKIIVASFDKMPSTVKLRATILGYAFTNGHIEHEIRVSLDSQSWEVYRRFTEFRKLHDAASEVPWSVYRLAPLETFGAPKLLLHTADALRERQTKLQALLSELVDKIRLTRRPLPALEQFLGLHFMMRSQVRREFQVT